MEAKKEILVMILEYYNFGFIEWKKKNWTNQ